MTPVRITDAVKVSACQRRTARITAANARPAGQANIAILVSHALHSCPATPFKFYLSLLTNDTHSWYELFRFAAPTCRKEQYRDYYMEHGCRSTKPVRNSVCSGNCGTDCCRPRRSKKRRLKLICNDGTRYTKEIEIVRKCGCSRKCL